MALLLGLFDVDRRQYSRRFLGLNDIGATQCNHRCSAKHNNTPTFALDYSPSPVRPNSRLLYPKRLDQYVAQRRYPISAIHLGE